MRPWVLSCKTKGAVKQTATLSYVMPVCKELWVRKVIKHVPFVHHLVNMSLQYLLKLCPVIILISNESHKINSDILHVKAMIMVNIWAKQNYVKARSKSFCVTMAIDRFTVNTDTSRYRWHNLSCWFLTYTLYLMNAQVNGYKTRQMNAVFIFWQLQPDIFKGWCHTAINVWPTQVPFANGELNVIIY